MLLSNKYMTASTIQYRKILASDVLKVKDFAFDVFIKLSPSKYLKIVTSDSAHFEEELSHYHKKASDYLYVDENAFNKITDILEKAAAPKVSIPVPLPAESFGISSDTYIFVHKIMAKLNVKELDLELIDTSFSSFFSNVKKNAELMKRLQRLLDQKDYITNHSLMTVYITTLTMKKIGENSQALQEKINLAAFFKDITLDNSQQARIWNKNDPKLKELGVTEAANVLAHPTKAAEVVKKLKNSSSDVEAMIRDHHELPDGSGFPKSTPAPALSQLSIVFNCACHFSQEAINQGATQLNPIQIFKKMDDLYSKGSFKTSYLALKSLILNQDSFE